MSSRSLNLVQLIGNLTRDPEMRYTPQGTAVCTMSLATNRSWNSQQEGGSRQEETTYHRIVVWSKLAEICSQMLKKGMKAYVSGRIQTRKWTTKEGQERETTEIVADNVIVLSPAAGGGRSEEVDQSTPDAGAYAYEEASSPAPAGAQDVSDDIPF